VNDIDNDRELNPSLLSTQKYKYTTVFYG
jgi:hypothetical protein